MIRRKAMLDPVRIWRQVSNGLLGSAIVRWDHLSSTNAHAKRLASQGSPEGTIVLATDQNRGRGRGEKTWHAVAGKGIYCSILLHPPVEKIRESAGLFPMLGSLAVIRSLESVMGDSSLEIKWPNDVLGSRGKKLSGSLAEYESGGEYTKPSLVLGIGININQKDEDFPDAIRPLATSLLMETGRQADLNDMAARLIAAVDQLYRLLLSGGQRQLLQLWKGYSRSHVDCEVRIEDRGRFIHGFTRGLDVDGSLRVLTENGETRSIRAGDVTLIRKKDKEP